MTEKGKTIMRLKRARAALGFEDRQSWWIITRQINGVAKSA